MSNKFPEIAIISISTHGEIRLNRDITSAEEITYDRAGYANVLPTFQINSKIQEFYKFNAVIPGLMSYVGGDDVFDDISEVEKMLKERSYDAYDSLIGKEVGTIHGNVRDIIQRTPFLNGRENLSSRANVSSLAFEIGAMVKQNIDHLSDVIKDEIKMLQRKGPLDEYEKDRLELDQGFIYNYDHVSNTINCLAGGNRTMINKTFFLTDTDIAPRENWSITLLNEPINKRIRIFEEIYNNLRSVLRSSTRNPRRSITMEQIVNYLADNGVKKLIVIDLTCCPIFGPYVDDPDVADTIYKGRTGALLRRSIIGNKLSYGGEKSRKRKRGYKKRKRTCKK